MTKHLFLFAALTLVACGPGKKPVVDAGPDIDAGPDDAGVDAGPITRMKGAEPPNGYQTALALPPGNGATVRMGVSASMALDQFGHPMLAGLYTDPNNDGIRVDDTLVFTRWNGLDKTADGGTIGFQPAVTIATTGEIDTAEPNRQVSLARDPSTGTIAIAFVTELKTIRIATSADEGVTWSLETASLPNASNHALSNPVLALANGVTHLAYFEAEAPCGFPDCGQVVYRKRTGKAAFTDTLSPAPAGTDVALSKPIALALDTAGNAGLAYFVGPQGGAAGAVSLLFWRPGSTPNKIADSGAAVIAKAPSVALTFVGTTPKVAYHLPSATVADGQLFYGAGSDAAGATFTAVAMPRNGVGTNLEGTQWFQGLAVDSAGKVAIAANHQSTAVSQQCTGGPKLSTSTDGTTFTTCRAEGGSMPTFGFAGAWMNTAFHKTGKVTLAFTYENASNPTIKAGIIVYRQP